MQLRVHIPHLRPSKAKCICIHTHTHTHIRLLISTTLKGHTPFSQPAWDGESSKNSWENPAPFSPQGNLSCDASLLRIRSSCSIMVPLQLRHGCRDSAISVCSKSNLLSPLLPSHPFAHFADLSSDTISFTRHDQTPLSPDRLRIPRG